MTPYDYAIKGALWLTFTAISIYVWVLRFAVMTRFIFSSSDLDQCKERYRLWNEDICRRADRWTRKAYRIVVGFDMD